MQGKSGQDIRQWPGHPFPHFLVVQAPRATRNGWLTSKQ